MDPRTLKHALVCATVLASSFPPAISHADPKEGLATTEITTSWAKALREARDLADVRRATGTDGKFEATETKGSISRQVFSWTGRNGKGRLRVLDYSSGGFAAIIDPSDSSGEIVMNSFGAFTCLDCSPPVNACGRRPSWIPHDLHWDNFDCPRTITGPQDMPSGG